MPFIVRHRQPAPAASPLTGPRAACLVLTLLARAACAQTGVDVAFVSEYTMRGLSLGPHPVLQLRVDHDTDDGWYGGAFASPVTLYGRAQGQLIVYGGRARPLSPGLSWDAGVSRTSFLRFGRYDYHEFYAGLTRDGTNVRLSYSPAWYDAGRTAYVELNGGVNLGERATLALHGGVQHGFDVHRGEARNRADLRAAYAIDLDAWRVQAGVQALVHGAGSDLPRARAVFAGASLRF